MKRIAILLMILFGCFVSPQWLQGQTPVPTGKIAPRAPDISHGVGARTPQLFQRAAPPYLPLTASPDVVTVDCPTEAQYFGALCGTLPVPLDRKHPQGAKINIYFELYLHTGSGPAESAILVNAGGPGVGMTYYRGLLLYLWGADLDTHDLLIIEDRGRGLSAAIDCPELQHGTAPFDQAETDCASQLGSAASWYGTGDVAMDTDAVRAALGYDKVDYWGGSYGGIVVTAYATRFGEHLRSIVLDAPEGAPAMRAFLLDGNEARATARAVRLDCVRSPTCSADHPNPNTEFQNLIQALRRNPVQGVAHDASGNSIQVRMDESALLRVAINPTGKFVGTGELLAAATALSQNDPVPLLRLGAEVTPLVGEYGDSAIWSQGDYYAAQCVDMQMPWNWSAPLVSRALEFAEATGQLPSDYFAPFSKKAGTSLGASLERQCFWWKKPTPVAPAAPPHATYPNVPTLVVVGDIDTLVPMEEVRQVADLFPGSTFLPMAEAGHETILWTACSAFLQSQFIETLQVGDISCTQVPETVWPALGRFPLHAADARAANIDPSRNQIEPAERKVVTVAVETAIDALKRSTIGNGNGTGLRGGTFQSSLDAYGNLTVTLTNSVFSNDVTVNGMLTWGADSSFVADLMVSGSGTGGGTLHVEGAWQAPGVVGSFNVTGSLGNKAVAAFVPEA